MRILHIGDLHFKSNRNNYEQNLMIDKMVKSLKTKEKIDAIFFTGDLVFSGTNPTNFDEAYSFLFKRLTEELDISAENIFVTEGNHDINRNETSKAVIHYFDEKVCDNDKLNDEYLNPSNDMNTSVKASEYFIQFSKKYFGNDDDVRNSFFSTHLREVNE